MLVRGRTRRSGAKGVSVTGENLWDLFDVARQVTQRRAEQRSAAQTAATADRRSNVHELWPSTRRA
jgi:error-prone DNA polymerase